MALTRCCCFELRTGTQILGWLGLIFGTIYAIYFSHLLSQRYHLAYGILLGTSVITFITSLLLIIGAIRNKKYFVLPHLVWNGIAIVLIIFATFYILFTTGNIAAIGKNFLEIALNIYFWFCVREYYISLDNNENETVVQYTSSSTTASNQNATAPINIASNQPPAYADIEKSLETKYKF